MSELRLMQVRVLRLNSVRDAFCNFANPVVRQTNHVR